MGGDMHGERGEDGAVDVVAELSEAVCHGARWVDVALDTVGHHQEMVAVVVAGVLLVFLVGHGSAE